jgi:CRP-like cAMP-binding protein
MPRGGANLVVGPTADERVRSTRVPEVPRRRTRHQTVTALEGVPLFAGFSRRHVERLAKATDELVYAPGDTIVEEGMLGETLFVVMEGKANVIRGGRKIAEVLPGEFFGELSTLDGGPRTASIVAATPVSVIRLFRHTLLDLLRDEPRLTLDLLEGIVRRIREIDRRIHPNPRR